MSQKEQKELYDNIMEEVVRIVNKHLNENADNSMFSMDALNKPENNLKIAQKFPDVYKCKQSPGKSLIGTTIQISEIDTTDKAEVTIYGKTFVEMCKKIAVIFMGPLSYSIHNLPEHVFNIELNSKFKPVWKKVVVNLDKDKIDDYGQALYFQVFENANSVQDVIAKLRTFKMK